MLTHMTIQEIDEVAIHNSKEREKYLKRKFFYGVEICEDSVIACANELIARRERELKLSTHWIS